LVREGVPDAEMRRGFSRRTISVRKRTVTLKGAVCNLYTGRDIAAMTS